LDELNHEIHIAQQNYDSVAWPEHNDIKLMKNMVGKANTNVSNMEKDKRIQDAYIDRLRKDIEISENELEQLAITAKSLKE
jgi:cob(I)alamin adenosyltransferase